MEKNTVWYGAVKGGECYL